MEEILAVRVLNTKRFLGSDIKMVPATSRLAFFEI